MAEVVDENGDLICWFNDDDWYDFEQCDQIGHILDKIGFTCGQPNLNYKIKDHSFLFIDIFTLEKEEILVKILYYMGFRDETIISQYKSEILEDSVVWKIYNHWHSQIIQKKS